MAKPPEVRFSPLGTLVARVRPEDAKYPWRAWNLDSYSDDEVADWTPLVPLERDRVTCPWCSRTKRALTPAGKLRHHLTELGARTWKPCEGTGRRPSDYKPEEN